MKAVWNNGSAEKLGGSLRKVRRRDWLVALLVVLSGALLYFQRYSIQSDFHDQLHNRLLAAAYAASGLLGPDYHSGLTGPDSISMERDLATVRRLTQLNKRLGTSFLYSAIRRNKEVILVSASASEERLARGDFVRYYTPYPEASPALQAAFDSNSPGFTIDEDRWGRFHACFVPFTATDGARYVVWAELNEALVDKKIHHNWLVHSAVVLLFVSVSLTATLYYIRFSHLAEQRLSSERARLQEIIDNAGTVIFVKDLQGRFTLVNKAFARKSGRESRDCIGKNEVELFGPDFAEVTAKGERALLEGGREDQWEEVLSLNGKTHVMLTQKILLRDRHGRPEAICGVVTDLTEERRVQEMMRVQKEELRRSEQSLTTLIEAIPDPVFFKDGQGRWLVVNRAGLELFDLHGIDWRGKSDLEIARLAPQHAEAFEYCAKSDALTWKEGRMRRENVVVKDASGQERIFDVTKVPLFDAEGTRTALLVISYDNTPQKLAEIELRKAQTFTQAILDNALTGIAFVDRHRIIRSYNRAAAEMFGFPPEEMVDQRTRPLFFSAEDHLEYGRRVADALTRNEVFEDERQLRTSDGRRLWCRLRARAVQLEDGQQGVIWSLDDVTDRHEYEARLARINWELEASRERLELILDSASLGSWDWRPKTGELFTNDHFLGMLGYPQDAFPNKTEKLTNLIHPDDLPRVRETLHPFITSDDGFYRCEHRLLCRDGRWKWVLDVGRVVERDSAGQALRFVGVHIDIDELKRLQLELATAKQQAEAADRAKGTFLANMSHELRTPLNGILGYAQLLRRGAASPEELSKGLAVIEQSGRHLLTLLNDILDLTKIESDRLELRPEPVALSAFMTDIAELYRAHTWEREVEFVLDLDPKLPEKVELDERRLRQVLFNLLGNAIKFTELGSVILRLQRTDSGGQEGRCVLRFEVEDSGPGIGEEELIRIFQPFTQTETGIQRGGTGLGLAIAKQLVERMGGGLEVASTPGRGSRFHFELNVPTLDPTNVQLGVEKWLPTGYEGPRRTLLLVDDEPANLELLDAMLRPLGLGLSLAGSTKMALTLIERTSPDLVLLDQDMREMNGVDFLKLVRQRFPGRDLPALVISSTVTEELRERALGLGFVGFIPKPIRMGELIETIGDLLALDWHYDDADRAQTVNSELRRPDRKTLEELLRLAKVGKYRRLGERLAELVRQDPTQEPFAGEVGRLAAVLDGPRLIELLSALMNGSSGAAPE